MSTPLADPAALSRLLDAVDDGKLRQVLQLVETSGQRRGLEPALAALRPRLCRLWPRRLLTLPRLLTVPFEVALTRAAEPDWPYSILRGHLGGWHALILAGLDPETVHLAAARIAGRNAGDRAAILAAGAGIWPAAAACLAAAHRAGEHARAQTERLWAADLMAIAVELVPLLWRLPSPLTALDPDAQEAVRAILALAETGDPDRAGLLASLVLRRATRPAALAPALLDLAPSPRRERLRPVLELFAARHRAELERRIAASEVIDSLPLEAAAEELWRLADALVGPEGGMADEAKPDPDTTALRRRAATVACQHYAASIDRVVAPLPEPAAAAPAAVKAREAEARQLARLARAARRLVLETPIERLTEAALRPLLEAGPSIDAPIGVDEARLVEILLGPDAAWQLLRPKPGERTRQPAESPEAAYRSR